MDNGKASTTASDEMCAALYEIHFLSHIKFSDRELEAATRFLRRECRLLTVLRLEQAISMIARNFQPFDYRRGLRDIIAAYFRGLRVELPGVLSLPGGEDRGKVNADLHEAIKNELKRFNDDQRISGV